MVETMAPLEAAPLANCKTGETNMAPLRAAHFPNNTSNIDKSTVRCPFLSPWGRSTSWGGQPERLAHIHESHRARELQAFDQWDLQDAHRGHDGAGQGVAEEEGLHGHHPRLHQPDLTCGGPRCPMVTDEPPSVSKRVLSIDSYRFRKSIVFSDQ